MHWPRLDGSSLQGAIDAAPDGATLEIVGAGSHGHGATRLIGPAPRRVLDDRGAIQVRGEDVRGLWNVGGDDVTIAHLDLQGFDAGVVTTADPTGRGGTTTVRDLEIHDTGRGIVSLSPGQLDVRHTTVSRTQWNGLSVTTPATLREIAVIEPGGAGIYLENTAAILYKVHVTGAKAGGIVAVQSQTDIGFALVHDTTKAGIYIEGGSSDIHESSVTMTHALADATFGDGVSLSRTASTLLSATLENNFIDASDRAGVGVYGADVSFSKNAIFCAAFDIDGETVVGTMYALHDLGDNQCGCTTSHDLRRPCEEASSMLAPPPPVGGLE